MRFLGIDPGLAIIGFGIVDKIGSKLKPIEYGIIETRAGLETGSRLKQIYESLNKILDKYSPDIVSIEKLYFNRNVTTALSVGQARGVIILACEQKGIQIEEYTPLQVKMAVVGYGQATKKQVQVMVKTLLSLRELPKPDDAADALAIAICEAHSYRQKKILKKELHI